MKKKLVGFIISIFFVVFFIGSYFVYNALLTESESILEISLTPENKKIEIKGQTESSFIGENQKTSEEKSQEVVSENLGNNLNPGGKLNTSSINELVMDQVKQTLITTKEEDLQVISNVLGSINEELNIEIFLSDGQQNSMLSNYEVKINYNYINQPFESKIIKSDKDGKLIFKATKPGQLNLQIISKDYSIYTKSFTVNYARNEIRVKLYKGNTLQVRARNLENNTIEGLTARIVKNISNPPPPISFPLEFDPNTELYTLFNVPLGSHLISFKSDGYLESPQYMVLIETKNIAALEIKLQKARMLYFDLDIKIKPELIRISSIEKSPMRHFERGENPSKVNFSKYSKLNGIGIYELELEDKSTSELMLYVDKYIPKRLDLSPDNDTYKVILEKGYDAKLFIKNEKGEPIKGAIISDTNGVNTNIDKTNEKGLTQLTAFSETLDLFLNVTHKEYITFKEIWAFDTIRQNFKTIVLVKGNEVSGKIKFGEKVVAGAVIQLFENRRIGHILNIKSETDGSYSISNIDFRADKEYIIKAFHREYGVATSELFQIQGENKVIDLSLVEEKSLKFKLLDPWRRSWPNKNIILLNKEDADFSLNILTDQKGEYTFINLIHGFYFIRLEDDELEIINSSILIPSRDLEIIPTERIFRKIRITTPEGELYKGFFKASFLLFGIKSALKIITKEDGDFYIELPKEREWSYFSFFIEVDGYSVVFLGQYTNFEKMPKEFNVKLNEGRNFSVKVFDNLDGRPMPNVSVDIAIGMSLYNSDGSKIQSLPTNELGEVLFNHLSGKFEISVKVKGFATYLEEINNSDVNERVIKLVKGGGLKLHLALNYDVVETTVFLKPNRKGFIFDSNGNLEIFNLWPGKYNISISRRLKNGKHLSDKIPVEIIIENEKILELNLDDYLK